MGRNWPRSRAVDVTKSLLQPTSVTDHIAVQVGPNAVINVAEEDLSPTQGSEAAFALRREGKLDTTMKLCLNWRQGNCHNHAACSFAHVVRYFGVTGDLPSPVATGRTAVFGSTTAGGGTYSSAAAGGTGTRGGAGAASSLGANTSWSQKLAPPSYSTPSAKSTTAPRSDERKAAAPAAAAPATASSARTSEPTATAEPKAAAAPPTPPTAPAAVHKADGVPPTARPTVAVDAAEAPATKMAEAPTSAPVETPHVPPAATTKTAALPAVLSADGLRSILLSLSTAATSVASSVPATSSVGEERQGEEEEEEEEMSKAFRPMEFLQERQAAASHLPTPPWQQEVPSDDSELITMLGKRIVGDFFSVENRPEMYARHVQSLHGWGKGSSDAHSQPRSETTRSPIVDYAVHPAQVMTPGGASRLFSTAPVTAASVTGSLGPLTRSGVALGGGHGDSADDGDMSVPGLSYQHLMNLFPPEE